MIEIFDIETLPNCFIYCALPEQGDKPKTFVCSPWHNDLQKLLKHLETPNLEQVGFNNINFDAQVINFLIQNKEKFLTLPGGEVARQLSEYAAYVIESTNAGEFPPTPWWQLPVKQIDLFRIHHFDNPARRTSLKALQIALRLTNVQDMPYHHTATLTQPQIDEVISYCVNDVSSTREFYRKSTEQIQLRRDLEKEYKTSFMHLPDTGVGEKIFALFLAEEMGIRMKDLKELRTHRDIIEIGKIILPKIVFEHPALQEILDIYQQLVVYGSNLKDSFSHCANVGELEVYYGLGGVHASVPAGIYDAGNQIIHDIDVTSLYPSISIVNGFRPKHLGKSFNDVYKRVFEERQKMPKNSPLNKAYKLMLNGVYGKSNNAWSYLYDPAFTLKITVNGQLLISMLLEKLVANGIEILQLNTDGITMRYPPEKTGIVTSLMEWWQKLTGLFLESAHYTKMVIRDCNNYLAIKTNGEVKLKGTFVTEPEYHKDHSFLVVPKALEAYYVHGTDPREFITNHQDFYDFLGRQKFNSNSNGYINTINPETNSVVKQPMQKNVRYYMSTDGVPLLKDLTMKLKSGKVEPRTIELNGGMLITVANEVTNTTKPDNINYEYYIDETYKIITAVTPEKSKYGVQETLF